MTVFVSQPHIDTAKGVTNRWMIIDGALLNDAHTVLPNEFALRKNNLAYNPLFLKTKWHDIADVGPILIRYDKDIEAWAQAQQPWHFGLVFESDAPLKALAQHWLTLSECQHQGLEGSLCRLYDGSILYHLLNQTDDVRRASWLGPIDRLWLPDYVSQQYFYTERPNVQAPTLESVTFTDPEWQGLSDAKQYRSAYVLTQHVDKFFPEYWLDKADKHAHAIEQLKRLAALGEVTLQGATYYMNILCRIGDIWDKKNWEQTHETRRPHQTIVSLLEQPGAQPLTDRLKKASQLAQAYHLDTLEHKEAIA